jgi:oligopeptide/dipeptide ABC transporter ATP-binding protein
MYSLEGTPPTPYEFGESCPFYSRCKLREDACTKGIPEVIHIDKQSSNKIDNRKVRCILHLGKGQVDDK